MSEVTIDLELYDDLLESFIKYDELDCDYQKQCGTIHKLKQALMKKCLRPYCLEINTLEKCLENNYALEDRDNLYNCEITFYEMQEFITRNWEMVQAKKAKKREESIDGE